MTSKQQKIDDMTSAPVDALRYVGRKTLRKLQGKSNENLTAAPDADSFGRSMMEKLGWKEGSGIGRNQDGITTHIRAKKRGGEGLGAGGDGGRYEGDNAKSCLEDGWYLKVFDDAKKAKKSKKSKKRKRDSSSLPDTPIIPSDAELLKATGGARLGRRAQPRGGEVGKMKRIAAADAAYLAKFCGGGGGVTVPATDAAATAATTTGQPKSKKAKKEAKEAKKLAKETKQRAKDAAKEKEFRWKKVIRTTINAATGSTLKRIKKKVVKAARTAFPNMSKDALKLKFDSKWNKMSAEDKSEIAE